MNQEKDRPLFLDKRHGFLATFGCEKSVQCSPDSHLIQASLPLSHLHAHLLWATSVTSGLNWEGDKVSSFTAHISFFGVQLLQSRGQDGELGGQSIVLGNRPHFRVALFVVWSGSTLFKADGSL